MSGFAEKIKALFWNNPFRTVSNRLLFGNSRQISGTGNTIRIGRTLLTNTRIVIRGDNNSVRFGDGIRLFDVTVLIRGDNCEIDFCGPGYFSGRLRCDGCKSVIRIGAGTTAEEARVTAGEGTAVLIGNDCALSSGVVVQSGDSHAIRDGNSGARINPAHSVRIGRHVWIAKNAIVLKGAVIGAGAVVGAGSVVTQSSSVGTGSIVVGSPASMVRQNIKWTREIQDTAE